MRRHRSAGQNKATVRAPRRGNSAPPWATPNRTLPAPKRSSSRLGGIKAWPHAGPVAVHWLSVMLPARGLVLLLLAGGATLVPCNAQGQKQPLSLCYGHSGIPPESCVSSWPTLSSEPGRVNYPKYTAEDLVGTGGNIELSVTINRRGVPQDIKIVKSFSKALDKGAIAALRQTRFEPGKYEGRVASARGTAVLHLSCSAYRADGVIPKTSDFTPVEDVATPFHWKRRLPDCSKDRDSSVLRHRVCAPLLIHEPSSEIEKDSKLAETGGNVILSARIGEHGYTQDIRIVTPAGEELNERAMALVRGWVFRPALDKLRPFPVRARLEVRFWSCVPTMSWSLKP